jgi:hypothetical protein
MLLNDVHEKDRLAYLLSFTIERHVRGVHARIAWLVAGLGAVILLFLFLWQFLQP